MKSSIQWNKVTWYSKLAAIILFGGVFVLGLVLGMKYQEELDGVESLCEHGQNC